MNAEDLRVLTTRLIEMRNGPAERSETHRYAPDSDYDRGQADAYELALHALYVFSNRQYGVDYGESPAPIGLAMRPT